MTLRTPLFHEQVALGARMASFAGWEMPIQYSDGILVEHQANRHGCSIFDCSHMGEFIIDGDCIVTGLDRIVTQSLADLSVGGCRYGFILNASGGVIDDLIVYRLADKRWMIVVNAANIEKDAAHFKAHLKDPSAFSDVSFSTAKIDLQGPLSRAVLAPWAKGVEALSYYTFGEFDFLGERLLISRTGYTGELGYEIYCPWAKAGLVWQTLLSDARVKPTGLGVRDVLRVEVCYPLYGHELTEEISPLEAGLARFVNFADDFMGREALLAARASGVARGCVFFCSDSRRSPRQGHRLFTADGCDIGCVTSGTFSPSLGCGIGMGFVKKEFTISGLDIIFGDVKFKEAARTVPRPFYRQGTLKH